MFSLTSTAFRSGESIPSKYTCDGERATNPPLEIHGIPNGTQSLVLLMEDPDVPEEVKPEGDVRSLGALQHTRFHTASQEKKCSRRWKGT